MNSLRAALVAVCLILGTRCLAQADQSVIDPSLESVLSFEDQPETGQPKGWSGGPVDTLHIETREVHGGKRAVRIERDQSSADAFSTVTRFLPCSFSGKRIELRGYLRTKDVSGAAALWMREDGAEGFLEFASLQNRKIQGTSDWTRYSIDLPVNGRAHSLAFGFMLVGTGTAWADDLELLVDGVPIWKAPARPARTTVLDRDHEFDDGSKISISELSERQIAQLATLGRVWGFLKYHHPKVVSGEVHWDFELFRVLPEVLNAATPADANAAMLRWVERLGEVKPVEHPVIDPATVALRADTSWIRDEALLGAALSARLKDVEAACPKLDEQFYLAVHRGVGNPDFQNEPAYSKVRFPDAGYQLLALFRVWNMVEYWFPYRDLIEDHWPAVLSEFIPRIALAEGSAGFQKELIRFIARLRDTHANLWSSTQLIPPEGDSVAPVELRFIGDEAVVVRLAELQDANRPDLQPGDVIVAVDGVSVTDHVAEWAPYYAASNQPTRLRDIARFLTRGAAGTQVALKLRRGGEIREVVTARVPMAKLPWTFGRFHDRSGPAFQLLTADVAYLKMSEVKVAEIPQYLEKAAGTKGWILDLRNYPADTIVYELGAHFVSEPTSFACFSIPNIAAPGTFVFREGVKLRPKSPRYAGKLVILLDETSQSAAEYTAMAFRAAPGALVVGSTTAAADGSVSAIPIPGGFRSMFSGIGVFYPDRRPTQRVGIKPDVEVKPTREGIAAGRDEVLEEGLRQILGPNAAVETIR